MTPEEMIYLGRQLMDIANNFHKMHLKPLPEDYAASLSGNWKQFPNACAIGHFVIIPRVDFDNPQQ